MLNIKLAALSVAALVSNDSVIEQKKAEIVQIKHDEKKHKEQMKFYENIEKGKIDEVKKYLATGAPYDQWKAFNSAYRRVYADKCDVSDLEIVLGNIDFKKCIDGMRKKNAELAGLFLTDGVVLVSHREELREKLDQFVINCDVGSDHIFYLIEKLLAAGVTLDDEESYDIIDEYGGLICRCDKDGEGICTCDERTKRKDIHHAIMCDQAERLRCKHKRLIELWGNAGTSIPRRVFEKSWRMRYEEYVRAIEKRGPDKREMFVRSMFKYKPLYCLPRELGHMIAEYDHYNHVAAVLSNPPREFWDYYGNPSESSETGSDLDSDSDTSSHT